MSICRTIFKKLFKKDIFDEMAEECESDNFDSILADTDDLPFWLFTRSIKKPKPSLDERLNPRYRKYKAYLERCYG